MIMNRLELLKRIERAQAEIEAAKKLLKDYEQIKVRKPEDGETFYYIDGGDIEHSPWDDSLADRRLYEMGEVFLDFEDARQEIKRRQTHHKLKELASKLNTKPVNFDALDQKKWSLSYLTSDERVRMTYTYSECTPGQVYFTDDCLDEILEVIPEGALIEYCRGEY